MIKVFNSSQKDDSAINEYNLILYNNITFRKQRGLMIILRGTQVWD